MQSYIIKIAQFNINDQEVYVSAWKPGQGEYVEQGDKIAEIETSKRIVDLEAEHSGYLYYCEAGKSYSVGETIGVILENPDEEYARELLSKEKPRQDKIKIMEKARKLAEQNNISIQELDHGKLIKEKDVEEYMLKRNQADNESELSIYLEKYREEEKHKAVIMIGAGEMAKMMIESMKDMPEYEIAGCLDDKVAVGSKILGIPVIGRTDEETLQRVFDSGVKYALNSIVGANFSLQVRERFFNKITNIGFELPVLIHPAAYVEESAKMGKGSFVHAHAYVGTEAEIGQGAIILTGTIVSHDCVIGNHAYISPGAVLGGTVRVGRKALVGMGTTVYTHVSIGEEAVIVNGVAVFSDVKKGERVTR